MTTVRRCGIVAIGGLLAIAGSHVLYPLEAKVLNADDPPLPVAQGAIAQDPRFTRPEVVEPPPAVPGAGEASLLAGDAQAPEGANVRMIDFTTALGMAGTQNPQIGIANQRIAEAYAQLRTAQILWLPAIRAGLSYNRHTGAVQGTEGTLDETNRSALESGLGMGAVGTGSPPVPGLVAAFRVTDAVFQPRIAAHTTAARRNAARATTHDLLLVVGLAYLDLLRAYQQQAIAKETLEHAQQLADLTAAFARAGQGAQADADRARAELVVRQNELERANEATQVASTRLVEQLSLDPAQLLIPCEPTILPVELVSRETPVAELISQGLTSRPELAESRQLVSEAVRRLQRERFAPLLPSVLLGVSYGAYGSGRDGQIERTHDRFDFDAIAFWEVRSLGLGESSARDEARARMCQAELRKVQVMDRIAREVAEGHAQVQARQRQIMLGRSGIEAASDSFRRNYQRIREGQGLPIEALQAIQALDQARRDYLRAVADYDEAQFRLYRAIGCALGDAQAELSQPPSP